MNKRLDHISLSVCPLETLDYQRNTITKATGFFYSESNRLFFITNWHVVTGRKPSQPSKILKNMATPCTLRIKLHKRQKAQDMIVLNSYGTKDITINSQSGDNPKWLEHPIHRMKVDVIGIEIKDKNTLEEEYAFNTLNKNNDFVKEYTPYVMDDIFVIGYPNGYPWNIEQTGTFPLYKKGCVSSEPLLDIGSMPQFLIDCRTASGMSGGPIIVQNNIFDFEYKLTTEGLIGRIRNFIGVYSGRFHEQTNSNTKNQISEIGIGWKKEALDSIVKNGVIGTKLSDITVT